MTGMRIQVIKHWKGVYAESKGLRKCQFPFCLLKGSRTALEEVTGPCNKSKLHDFHFLFLLSSNCNSYYLLKFMCESPVIGTWIGGLSWPQGVHLLAETLDTLLAYSVVSALRDGGLGTQRRELSWSSGLKERRQSKNWQSFREAGTFH